MKIESELKSKSYYIGFYAKMANDHVDSLKEYSDKLVCEIKQIQMEMEMLREKNKKLEEALDFYADRETYRLYEDEQGRTCKAEQDNGHKAREVLRECEL